MSQADELRDPLELLAAEFIDRQRRGESPSIAEYARQHPDMASEIEDLFPTIAAVEQLKSVRQQSQSGGASLGCVRLERLGDFRIIGEIGRGGMGIVYQALQESLGRHVAVKVLPKQLLVDSKQLCRFQREARTAARLHHTNIVPVFGVGEHEGFHFIVMQLIRGVGLDAVLDKLRQDGASSACHVEDQLAPTPGDDRTSEAADLAISLVEGRFCQARAFEGCSSSRAGISRPAPAQPPTSRDASSPTISANEAFIVAGDAKPDGAAGADSARLSPASSADARRFGPPYWRSVAAIGLQVAEALEYAHTHQTLHRDIKPANLLLDRQGTVWVTDFGLAKAMEQDNLTQTGAMAGTLRYMAPEQFAGRFDARSDVYSLGLTLYEMLVLHPAFDDAGRSSLIRKITCETPTRPRKLNPKIPRDLETIVLKAIAREPADRYQAAGDLARDLECFLDDRPIYARRTSAAERLWRWSRRNKALAGLAATTLALLVLVAAVASTGYVRTTRANIEEARQRKKAEDTSALALDALDNIFQQFAPERATPATGLSAISDTGEEVAVPVQPVLSKEAAALLQRMLDFYDRLAAQEGGDARLRRKVAQANRRVGDIRQRLGQYEESKAAYFRAIDLYKALADQSVADAELATEIARIQNELGNVHSAMNEQGAARSCHMEALAALESVSEHAVDSPQYKYELARTCYFLARRPRDRIGPPPPGMVGRRGPRPDRPEEFAYGGRGPHGGRDGPRDEDRGPPPVPPDAFFGLPGPVSDDRPPFPPVDQDEHRYNSRKAIEILEQLIAEHPSAPDYRHLLARCYRDSFLPPSGPGQKPRGDNADDYADKAVAILQKLVEEYPNVPDYRYDLSETYAMQDMRGPFLPGPPAPAAEVRSRDLMEKALAISEELVAEHPNIPDYAVSQVHIRLRLAFTLGKSDPPRAEANLRKALEVQAALARHFPQNYSYKFGLAVAHESLAAFFREFGRLTEARSAQQDAIAAFKDIMQNDPRAGPIRGVLAHNYANLADLLRRMGDETAAAEAARQAEALRPER